MDMIITIIIWAAIIQGFLLGIIFIVSKKRRSFANKLLGYFLLTFVLAALSDLLPFNEIGNYSLSGYFTLPEVKLLFPLLFLHFVLEKVGRTHYFRLFLSIHYLLAFAIIGITLINVILVLISGNSLQDLLDWKYLESVHLGQQYYAFILTIGSFCIALKKTRRYRNLIRNEFTDMYMLDIKWLWQFILLLTPIILFWGAELLRIARGGTGQSDLTTYAYLGIAFFNYFVSYNAFTHQTLFDGSTDNLNSIISSPLIAEKSNVPVDDETCVRIQNEMKIKQYYLNQDLTLYEFAKEIQISARTISSCINQGVGMNFNEWVNGFRVEKAMKTLKDQDSNHLSIEGIGSNSGFKSRSAMYAAFKKKPGKSPGNFR